MKIIKNLIPQEIKNIYHGFSALLACLYYRYPAKDLIVIGVTGTDGKTTTASILHHVLNQTGHQAALISTVSAFIGRAVIDTGAHTTTPNEWRLQKLIKNIRDQNIKYLVLETTSIGLDQHRLLGTNIQYAVYTNISHEHLDYHHSLTAYARSKAKLARHAKLAVISRDNDIYSHLQPYLDSQTKIAFYCLKDFSYATKLAQLFPPVHNQQNALAAITLLQNLGIDWHRIYPALKSFPGVPGRLEPVKNSRGLHIYVDFAHTPNAVRSVLTHLRSAHKKGKLITVFGATGRRDPQKRPLMGDIASRLADEVVLTSDDNYDEDVNIIIRQIKEGVKTNHGHVHSQPDRYAALKFALNTLAQKGDTVAVLGQGHEQTINLDGKNETSWNDVKMVRRILKKS